MCFTYKCDSCGKPCQVIEVDFGIGPHEYWGSVSNHIDIQAVSNCCETDYTELDPTSFRDFMIIEGGDKHLQGELF